MGRINLFDLMMFSAGACLVTPTPDLGESLTANCPVLGTVGGGIEKLPA
jgi:hypothetical protein